MREVLALPLKLEGSLLSRIGAAALAFFLFTLNHWVSLLNLPTLIQAAGWEWIPPAIHPLNYLLTIPVRWLPAP